MVDWPLRLGLWTVIVVFCVLVRVFVPEPLRLLLGLVFGALFWVVWVNTRV